MKLCQCGRELTKYQRKRGMCTYCYNDWYNNKVKKKGLVGELNEVRRKKMQKRKRNRGKGQFEMLCLDCEMSFKSWSKTKNRICPNCRDRHGGYYEHTVGHS